MKLMIADEYIKKWENILLKKHGTEYSIVKYNTVRKI